MVIAFIDEHRDQVGVEPICRVLTAHGVKIAASTYYAHHSRPRSPRSLRDDQLGEAIERIFCDRRRGRGLAGVHTFRPSGRTRQPSYDSTNAT